MAIASPTLLISGAVSMLAGASFALVARAVSRQSVTGPRLLARRAHTVWWMGLGVYLLLQGAMTIFAANGALSLGVYLGSRVALIPVLCLATWGITFYLTYLYTGNERTALPLATLYAVVGVLFFYATFSIPQTLFVKTWIVSMDDSSTLMRIVYALVGLPPIAASLAYLGLLRRTADALKRYRISLAAGSILFYVASGLAARLSANDAVIFATLVPFGILAAVMSILAYYPPASIRRRLERGLT